MVKLRAVVYVIPTNFDTDIVSGVFLQEDCATKRLSSAHQNGPACGER